MIYKLKDLIKIKYGKNQKKVECEAGCYHIIGTGGIIGKSKEYLYDKPSVLIGRKGTIDKVRYIDEPFWTIDTLFYTEINEKIVLPKYLYYKLSMINFKNYNEGTTIPSLKTETLYEIEVDIDDMTMQKKIVKILSKLEDKIRLNNQINDNLHDLAEQLFFEIYKNGRERTLGDLLENISTGARPKGGAQKSGIPSVGAEKIEKFGVYDYSSEKYIAEDFYEKLKNGKMNSGDVLLYKDGAYTGKVSMCLNWFPHKKSAVNEHVFILNTENNWAQNYLYFTLYNKQNKEMLERLAGAKAAQPGLNQTELKSLKINICDKEFIKKFENEVKPIMESIANNSLENKKLVELRDTLLPKLMNGEINLDKIEI